MATDTFRFQTYTKDELEPCFKAFKQQIKLPKGTRRQTRRILRWFGKTAGPDVRVYPQDKRSEYMVDLCHIRFPSDDKRAQRWTTALREGRCQMRLVLESEFARPSRKGRARCQILDDAMKIAVIRADIKVMIFASNHGRDRDELFKDLASLREITGDDAPWLCIDVPWGVTSGDAKIECQYLPKPRTTAV